MNIYIFIEMYRYTIKSLDLYIFCIHLLYSFFNIGALVLSNLYTIETDRSSQIDLTVLFKLCWKWNASCMQQSVLIHPWKSEIIFFSQFLHCFGASNFICKSIRVQWNIIIINNGTFQTEKNHKNSPWQTISAQMNESEKNVWILSWKWNSTSWSKCERVWKGCQNKPQNIYCYFVSVKWFSVIFGHNGTVYYFMLIVVMWPSISILVEKSFFEE